MSVLKNNTTKLVIKLLLLVNSYHSDWNHCIIYKDCGHSLQRPEGGGTTCWLNGTMFAFKSNKSNEFESTLGALPSFTSFIMFIGCKTAVWTT